MNLKSTLFGMVIGILFTITVGVIATVLYSAKDIGFEPNNSTWQVNNVEDAIKDIKNTHMSGKADIVTSLNSIGVTPTSDSYSDINNSIRKITPLRINGATQNYSSGNLTRAKRSAQITLEPGKYIVVGLHSFAHVRSDITNTYDTATSYTLLECTDCTSTVLKNNQIVATANAKTSSTLNVYTYNAIWHRLYYVVVNSKSTVSFSTTWPSEYLDIPSTVSIDAVKIAD